MKGFTRFLFVNDSHGDMIDWNVWKECLSFKRFWKPHLTIHGGDALDLRPWRKGAGADEKMERITEDWVAFQRLFEELQPQVFLKGNHDIRLDEGAHSASNADRAMLCEKYLEDMGVFLDKIKCNRVLPYHHRRGIYQVGDVSFLHGYKASMHCAKAHAESYGSCIFGHTHTYQRYTAADIREVTAISSPILGQIDMPYLDRCVGALRHRQGWTYGVVHEKTGAWEAWSVVFDPVTGGFIDPIKMIAPLLSGTVS